MDVLFKRHIRETKGCSVCGYEEETILHSLFECKYALQIWEHSEFTDLIMESPSTSLSERLQWIVASAGLVKFSEEYQLYNGKVRMNGPLTSVRGIVSWSPPPQDCVKVNVDAHLNDNGVSFGVVIRDDAGRALVAAVKKVNAKWSPALAEAGATRYGMELARRLSYANVILECDAL
ncbi:hypothetical protein POM88_011899 [Heracleum sosnowskyi]|uniref:RNase H type-1 domain-containing protein n=1 Tax=Heracleum sosnowskyi TaxID=360622 RepID=A0AAD8IX26_9APIA|nr:hypothetical protein POM88_011899 [Heracleum sosnowskyi]